MRTLLLPGGFICLNYALLMLHPLRFAQSRIQESLFSEGPDKNKRGLNGWKNAGLSWSYHLETEKMYLDFYTQATVIGDSSVSYQSVHHALMRK